MQITETADFGKPLRNSGFHLLTFAETGFSILRGYGDEFGLDAATLERFADEVHRRDDGSSLMPKAPISAIPRRFIRDNDRSDLLAAQIKDFLKANKQQIKAKRLLIDFRSGVEPFVLDACRSALDCTDANFLEEVVIVAE